MERDEIANASLFVMCAKTLWGEHWIGPAAQHFNVNERTLRRIGAAERGEGDTTPARALLRPMLERLRLERTTIDTAIAYVEKHAAASVMGEEFFAVLRFIDQEHFDLLAGYDGVADTCHSFGWIIGWGGERRLTGLGRAAYETELAERERRGLSVDPDPFALIREKGTVPA